jgi:hypothetical protein
MKKIFSMRDTLSDPLLLAGAMPGASWAGWRALLIALAGEALTKSERKDFKRLTLRAREPGDGKLVEAFVCVAGRRGGKSMAMATLGVYLATCCDWTENLSLGEYGRVMLVAPSLDQARNQMNYCRALIRQTELLSKLIENETADELELRRNIILEVQAASAARSRGKTAVAICLDECAFLKSGDTVDSDVDLVTALRPSLATTRGPLLLTSTPSTPFGLTHTLFKKHYKPDGSKRCLVAHGSSKDFNPSLEQTVVDQAYEDDPEGAEAEFGGKFRTPLSAYLRRETVEACIDQAARPRRYFAGVKYFAHLDAALGGSRGNDSFTTSVGHAVREGDRIITVIDDLRELLPPFDPHEAVKAICTHLRFWRCTEVMGDQYGRPFISQFGQHGIRYVETPISTSEVYLHALASWNAHNVAFPIFEDIGDRAIDQLIGLRRKVGAQGRETVDHIGANTHDDLAVVICGVIYQCTPIDRSGLAGMSWGNIGVFTGAPGGPISGPGVGGQLVDKPRTPEEIERREKARWSNGEPPPLPKYAGLVHGMGGVNPVTGGR